MSIHDGFYRLAGEPVVGMNLCPPGCPGACVLEEARDHFSIFHRRPTKVLVWRLTCAECGDVFRLTTGPRDVRIGPRCRACYHASRNDTLHDLVVSTQRRCVEAGEPFTFAVFKDEARLTCGRVPVTRQHFEGAFVVERPARSIYRFRRPTPAEIDVLMEGSLRRGRLRAAAQTPKAEPPVDELHALRRKVEELEKALASLRRDV